MPNKKPDNPPAFPIHTNTSITEQGMTLRDYFAAKAMQGLIASNKKLRGADGEELDNRPSVFCNIAYELADAMLAEREKQS